MDPITRDFYEERRRKWRRSAFWRGVLVTVLLLVALGALGAFFGGGPRGEHVARVRVDEVIFSDPAREQMLQDIAESTDVRALIVRINSPGGTVVGSEALYEALSEIGEDIPVVAVMDGVAASGGYMAALGADHIVARGNTITGSIGVIYEFLTFASLLERLGVSVETIRSSELKAASSPVRDLSPEARAAEQRLVDETYGWFRGLVEVERELTGAALDAVTDGRTFTGRMALEANLVDAIGDERTALDWLKSVTPDLEGLPIEDWAPERERPGALGLLGRLTGFSNAIHAQPLAEGPRLMSILK